MRYEWYWEGNIVSTLVAFLAKEGWTDINTADTKKRGHGADISARRDKDTLIVEAKGYPSKFYQRGEKKGRKKPTNPPTQARHWYAELFLTAILRQGEFPKAVVAIVFPDIPPFPSLFERTARTLKRLSLIVYTVNESGTVSLLEV